MYPLSDTTIIMENDLNQDQPCTKKVWQKPDFVILDTDNVNGGGNNNTYNERSHYTAIAGQQHRIHRGSNGQLLRLAMLPDTGFYFADFVS